MDRIKSGQVVFDAVVDLVQADKSAHRITIAEQTGLKLSVVDDHLKRMTADGRVRRIERGRYLPTHPSRPDRAVSVTVLPDMTVKMEIGDHVLDLSMREARMVVMSLGGTTYLFGNAPVR